VTIWALFSYFFSTRLSSNGPMMVQHPLKSATGMQSELVLCIVKSTRKRAQSLSGQKVDQSRHLDRIGAGEGTVKLLSAVIDRALDGEDLVSIEEVLHHGTTGTGQIAKIRVWNHKDRGSARVAPFLRSPTRTVEGASSPHCARTGDTEVHDESSDLCRNGCLARHD
jgi:hypothetical protein